MLRRFGYKSGIIIGLSLYAIGALLFLPAAELQRYSLFLVALFIIASGATVLETTANPFITLLGSPERAAQRLNLVQSFNGLGAAVAPLIGGLLIFSGIEYSPEQLADMTPNAVAEYRQMEAKQVQFPYLLLAASALSLAIVVYFVRFPPVSHSPQPNAHSQFSRSTLRVLWSNTNLRYAVFAQAAYVGAQVGLWSFYIDFIKDVMPEISEKTAAYWLSLSLFSFMIGRFVGTALMNWIRPSTLLAIYGLGTVALLIIAASAGGFPAVFAYGACSFFMSIMFPTIFSLGLSQLQQEQELGASLLIMAIIGGAVLPPLMGLIGDMWSLEVALFAPLGCFLVVTIYGLSTSKIQMQATAHNIKE